VKIINVVLFSKTMLRRLFNNTVTTASVSFPLEEPKQEIFGSRVYMQSKPVLIDDLGTRQRKSKF
jgi:hypothetical protein